MERINNMNKKQSYAWNTIYGSNEKELAEAVKRYEILVQEEILLIELVRQKEQIKKELRIVESRIAKAITITWKRNLKERNQSLKRLKREQVKNDQKKIQR